MSADAVCPLVCKYLFSWLALANHEKLTPQRMFPVHGTVWMHAFLKDSGFAENTELWAMSEAVERTIEAPRNHGLCLAGFGACYHLLNNGFEVTLLDASDNPGGLSSGWRTAKGRAVEAGKCGHRG